MATLFTLSNHVIAEVMQHPVTGQKSLHALRSFQTGETIQPFTGRQTLSTPSYLTVQTGINKHILLEPLFLQYINHSCNPNVLFDTDRMVLSALKPIQTGEELTFFYPSTEWIMVQPFSCNCGEQHCLGEIKGAAFIPETVLKNYQLTSFIQNQLYERSRHSA